MNPSLIGATQTLANLATVGGLLYAVFGPRERAHDAATIAIIGVGVNFATTLVQGASLGVVSNPTANTTTGTGTGGLPSHCACGA